MQYTPPRYAFRDYRGGTIAHTPTQRLRQLTKIAPELAPLFIVTGAAVVLGLASITNKALKDRHLRLWTSRQEPSESEKVSKQPQRNR